MGRVDPIYIDAIYIYILLLMVQKSGSPVDILQISHYLQSFMT